MKSFRFEESKTCLTTKLRNYEDGNFKAEKNVSLNISCSCCNIPSKLLRRDIVCNCNFCFFLSVVCFCHRRGTDKNFPMAVANDKFVVNT